MSLLIDSHVHVYACHDSAALLHAFDGRIRAAGASAGILMLAERAGTDVFAEWSAGHRLPDGCSVTRADETSLVLRRAGAPDTLVVSGRQIACAEHVEVLALATRATFPDGRPAAESLLAVRSSGALPVLAWGIGKWLFKRARVIESLLDASRNEPLFVADPSLRPVFWPTPRLMRRAAMQGHRILAGSDPLPPKTEETRVGQYADLAPGAVLDFNAPLTPQIVSILATHPLRHTGHRSGPCEFLQRMTDKG